MMVMDAPVVIVTGAGSGIGRALCLLLGSTHRLVLVGRREDALQETAETMSRDLDAAKETLIAPADLTDAEQAASVIALTMQQWGRVDALVNNAGTAPNVRIGGMTHDMLYDVFAANVFGPAHLILGVWPIMIEQGGGVIVNVSSMSASDPFPGFFAYGASKAALESFTRSIEGEGAAAGIRAYAVAPGAVETSMLRGWLSESDLPRSRTLPPRAVAQVIVDCLAGGREADRGRVIALPSP